MRRFLTTGTGKALCHFLALAIALPFMSLISIGRAEAQIQLRPQWAVVPFVNDQPGNGGADYANLASQAVYDELAKSNTFDLTPLDSVNRSIQDLGLATPVTDPTSLLRLAQALNVGTLVTGELVGWNIYPVQGGKQAEIGLKVKVIDVASGLAVNGAGVVATSPVRSVTTSQDDLIKDAFAQGAAQAVSAINSQTLPTATILNTRITEGLINRGARDGFVDGQIVIVTRGREEVATARVFGVEPDSANVHIIRQIKGIQPGDKVRVVFQVPDVVMTGGNRHTGQGGHPVVREPSKPINSSGIISAALVLGFVAFLLGGGRENNNQGAHNVIAEATTFPSSAVGPAIKVSWQRDVFYHNQTATQFLIYRSDTSGTSAGNGFTLVQVEPQVPGGQSPNNFVYDIPGAHTFNAAVGLPQISSLQCAALGVTAEAATGPTADVPNLYQVQLVYNAPSQTGTATCYYVTDPTTSVGLATMLAIPTLETPIPNQSITQYVPFQFTSVGNGIITIGYVVQVSDNPNFTGTVVTSTEIRSIDITDQSISFPSRFTGDTFTQFAHDKFGPSVTQLFWRVGVRNVADNPGPVPDPTTHLRYEFSPGQPIQVASSSPPAKALKALKGHRGRGGKGGSGSPTTSGTKH